MSIIKITDNNDNITTHLFAGYSLELLEEKLILTIYSINSTLRKYTIYSDSRESNIHNIEIFISDYFDNILLNNNCCAYIEEFFNRNYIHIGHSGSQRRFTMNKR